MYQGQIGAMMMLLLLILTIDEVSQIKHPAWLVDMDITKVLAILIPGAVLIGLNSM
jgi:hypothetical protein